MLLLALIAALAPASALGSFPGGDGVIAYSAGGSIWAVDPSTGNQLRLSSGADDSAPAFSPSGNLLAFQRWAGGSLTIYLANANGSDARPLVRGAEPAFAPSGRQVVFVRRDGIFITGIAPGSTVQQLTHQPGDRGPQWSSRGSIVFERTDVWRVRHQGRSERRARNELELISHPGARLSPILTHEESRIEMQYTDGSLPQVADMWPDWSPDGKSLTVTISLGCEREANGLPPLTRVLKSSPRLALHFSCYPSAWAPEGQGFAESGLGMLSGSPFESCPVGPDIDDQIAWQPLLDGTPRVPTVPCAGVERMAVSPEAVTSEPSPQSEPPSARSRKTTSCSRRHHVKHCKR